MDDRVFARFGEDAVIWHAVGGTTACKMIIEHDIDEFSRGFDGAKQTAVPDVLGSFKPGDAVNVVVGDQVKFVDGNHGAEVVYSVGVLYPIRENIVTVALHEVAP